MATMIRLTRSGRVGPGCVRPFQVMIDGKRVEPIGGGKTNQYPVQSGRHRLQVKQDFYRSDELTVLVEEGAVTDCECGCYVEGWQFFMLIFWVWRALVPGKLFYVRKKSGASPPHRP